MVQSTQYCETHVQKINYATSSRNTSNRPGSHRVRVTNMTDTLNGTPQMNFYKDLD